MNPGREAGKGLPSLRGHVDLHDITPIAPGEGQAPWLPGLLQAFLLRAQFRRAQARAMGWRGIRPSLSGGESWTCRVLGMPGVYGLLFEAEHLGAKDLSGEFSLHYFPHPEEPRAEMFPLAAAVLAQTPDYWDKVRDFPLASGTAGPFQIATLRLCAALDGRSLCLSLSALSRQRVLSLDGVPAPQAPGGFVVAPGGLESDVPAYCLAMHLFKTLASTVTNGLGEAPERFRLRLASDQIRACSTGGHWTERSAPGVQRLRLDLEYGPHSPAQAQAGGVDRLAWRRGLPPGRFQRQPWLHAHRPDWLRQAGRKARASVDRPELLILSGFLGAGKTTLLRRLIEHCLQRDRFVAVIQNEIGEIGLDGKLLDHDASVVEIDEGCVCCSLAGQLKKGLAQVLERFRPDVVVLETSGLANPKNLLGELGEVADVVDRGALVVVVDGANIEDVLAQSAVARDQIEAADVLVVNKADLLSREDATRVGLRIREINARALQIQAHDGDIPFGLICDTEGLSAAHGRPVLSRYQADRHPAHAAEGYAARTIHCGGTVASDALREALVQASAHAFRIKGIVDVGPQAAPHLVQVVAGRVELTPLADPGPGRCLTCIGQDGLDAACLCLARLWNGSELQTASG